MTKVAQLLLYAAFAVVVGYLSVMPRYPYADPSVATIKLSLSHAADRVRECVRLTPDEINARAQRGESLNDCERERLPLTVEIDIDGTTVLHVSAEPSGLWSDGPASVYERFDVAAGRRTITARLRDSARDSGWDYEHTETVELRPGRYFTVRFRAETGGFAFR
jgi:hypothetical protein